jgi:glycerophosphoryl diester phosphodiesterase
VHDTLGAVSHAPHPQSVIYLPGGREVQLKVHQCLWSGNYPANSLPAIEECYRAAVARVEIDAAMLRDADFLVVHDLTLDDSTTGHGPVSEVLLNDARSLRIRHDGRVSDHAPPLLSEVVELIRVQPDPTLMELDLKEERPMPWPRVEELARIVEPVKDRVTLAGGADWNLRRLLEVDPSVPVGWDPGLYFDWAPADDEEASLPLGAYGYRDAHPLARQRTVPVQEYVWDRFTELLLHVPGVRELHFRLDALERVLDDGAGDVVDLMHRRGVLLDAWTLDADTPNWRERLQRALSAGADIVTTNTPHLLSAVAAQRGSAPSRSDTEAR